VKKKTFCHDCEIEIKDCRKNPIECMRKRDADLYFEMYDKGLGWVK
jgi:hypothetical protein